MLILKSMEHPSLQLFEIIMENTNQNQNCNNNNIGDAT
jgi:hypothetical protein